MKYYEKTNKFSALHDMAEEKFLYIILNIFMLGLVSLNPVPWCHESPELPKKSSKIAPNK